MKLKNLYIWLFLTSSITGRAQSFENVRERMQDFYAGISAYSQGFRVYLTSESSDIVESGTMKVDSNKLWYKLGHMEVLVTNDVVASLDHQARVVMVRDRAADAHIHLGGSGGLWKSMDLIDSLLRSANGQIKPVETIEDPRSCYQLEMPQPAVTVRLCLDEDTYQLRSIRYYQAANLLMYVEYEDIKKASGFALGTFDPTKYFQIEDGHYQATAEYKDYELLVID